MLFRLITPILLSTILLGCSAKNTNNSSETGTVEETYNDKYIKAISQQLQYSLNRNGIYRNEVRLWTIYEATNGGRLFSIRDTDSISYLTKHYYLTSYSDENYYADSVWTYNESSSITAIELTSRLYDLGFKELATQPDSIQQMIGDGTTIIVEVQDTSYYKQIYYNSPEYFDDQNHRTFSAILSELESAMKYRRDEI